MKEIEQKDIFENELVVKNKDGSATITLKYPKKFEADDITQIKLRRPNYKESKHSRTLKEEEILDYFLTTLSERPIDLIDMLDPSDIGRMDAVVMDFLGLAVN